MMKLVYLITPYILVLAAFVALGYLLFKLLVKYFGKK